MVIWSDTIFENWYNIDDLEQKVKQTVGYREKYVVAASDDDDHQDKYQRN